MKAKFLIPFAIFIFLVVFLFKGLYLDPRHVPSALADREDPLPAFELPTLFDPTQTFNPESMKGKVWMPNVWSSWCQPCKEEHPFLVSLKRSGLKTPIVGFLYKDDIAAGRRVLERSGNPYDAVFFEPPRNVAEGERLVAVDLGITGVPETFIIDKKGRVRHKVSYPITDMETVQGKVWSDEVKPLLEMLEAEE